MKRRLRHLRRVYEDTPAGPLLTSHTERVVGLTELERCPRCRQVVIRWTAEGLCPYCDGRAA